MNFSPSMRADALLSTLDALEHAITEPSSQDFRLALVDVARSELAALHASLPQQEQRTTRTRPTAAILPFRQRGSLGE